MPPSAKLHRWLDLIAYLAGRRFPVSIDQVMDGVPAYASRWQDGDETARASVRRSFERDKDELKALGIPIALQPLPRGRTSESSEGYRLERRDFYLPYLRLLGTAATRSSGSRQAPTPAESAIGTFDIAEDEAAVALEGLRHLAELPDFPLAAHARSAYRKLTFDLDPGRFVATPIALVARPSASNVSGLLHELSDARRRRKRVTFRYRGIVRNQVTLRSVDPYALLYLQANWYVVGHDRSKDAIRTFRVSRMQDLEVNARQPHAADYEIPEDFRAREYASRKAWELGGEDERPHLVRVLFHFPCSLWADRNGFGTSVERRPDGGEVRNFEVRDHEAFLRWILGLEGQAEIQLPAELRVEARRRAESIARLHGEVQDA